MNLKNVQSMYFIGMNGVSMKGLATYFKNVGLTVAGSDLQTTGHEPKNITQAKPKPDLVIKSAAITPASAGWVEVEQAQKMGIPVKERAWLIGELMRQKNTYGIAIAGMHGKSTTTAMLGKVLVDAGYDPLILCGALMPEYSDSVRLPEKKSKVKSQKLKVNQPFYVVAEACEYEKQFLKFAPKAVIITNIDKEHLDTYPRGLPQIIRAFRDFVKLVPSNGLIVLNGDDQNCRVVAKSAVGKVKFFSDQKPWPGLKLKIVGDFNLLNAAGAARLAHELGISSEIIKASINNFTGISRRLEYKGTWHGTPIYDDYGHHPTEIAATINAIKKVHPDYRIIIVFQPHQFSRTKALLPEFSRAFNQSDMALFAPIYEVAGRDNPHVISNDQFFKSIVHPNKLFIKEYGAMVKYLKKIVQPKDIIITLGATPIYQVADQLIKA